MSKLTEIDMTCQVCFGTWNYPKTLLEYELCAADCHDMQKWKALAELVNSRESLIEVNDILNGANAHDGKVLKEQRARITELERNLRNSRALVEHGVDVETELLVRIVELERKDGK